jgi:hypothetical protein
MESKAGQGDEDETEITEGEIVSGSIPGLM